MRSWTAELDGDSGLATNPLLNPDYTALLLRLIPHVYQEQPLAARDPGLQPQQRPVLVDFKCLGLFVERPLFCAPAVNKQGYAMRPTRAFPALDGVGRLFARFVGTLYGVPLSYMSPFSFSFFQSIPDAAHRSLPKSSTYFGSTINDSLQCESPVGNVQTGFRLGNLMGTLPSSLCVSPKIPKITSSPIFPGTFPPSSMRVLAPRPTSIF